MDFLKNRYIFLWISIFIFILSIFLILVPKLNLGIDMTWWIQIEYSYENNINIDTLVENLNTEKENFLNNWEQIINNINAYTITWEKTVAVVVWFYNIDDEKKLENLKNNFKDIVFNIIKSQDKNIEETKYINIWKSFWDYIKKTAYITLAIAIIWITLYVTFAFSWAVSWISIMSFAIITIITLFHDLIISTWFYIFTSIFFKEFQIDTFFITALLTILWYSINDTIVVFDRIRNNLKLYAWKKWSKWKNIYEIINLSINETITRSIYTSLTLFMVLLTIFIFWPESISWFILVMIYGTIVWTYSSIFIASPILYEVNKNRKLKEYKKQIVNPEDKIVV